MVEFLSPKSILDYGCGKGGLVKALAKKYPSIKVYGYDPAVKELESLPSDEVDFVVCTNVLEHVPEDELTETVAQIAAISQNVFFHLHHAKAAVVLENGENAHCTVWTPAQYHNLFKRFFPALTFLPGYNPAVNTSCTTFILPPEVKNQCETLIRTDNPYVMHYINSLEDFQEFIKNGRELILFPADGEGESFLEFLKYSNQLESICCVAIREALNNNSHQTFYKNRAIIPFEMLAHFRETAMMLVAAPSEYHQAIHNLIRQFGFKKIIFLSDEVIKQAQTQVQQFISSGQIILQFVDDVTKKLNELEFHIDEREEIIQKNTAAFAEYKNAFRGKKIVIFATGPTAKYYKPMPDAIHIGLNFSVLREDIPLDFLFTGDKTINRGRDSTVQSLFDRVHDKVFISHQLINSLYCFLDFGEDISSIPNVRRFYIGNIYDYESKPIRANICLHPPFTLASIAEAAIHFALFTYPKEIYLVGCDVSRGGHFYKAADSKPEVDNRPVSKLKLAYARFKMFARQYYPDTEIISINPVGLKGLFKDVYTDEYLKTLD